MKIEAEIMKCAKVYINGNYDGDIKPIDDGWAYYPKCSDFYGFVFESIEEVLDDLKGV